MAKREFNPKSFLMIFLSLSLAALFLFFSSTFATDVYSNIFEEERFGKGVMLGPISLHDATNEEALSLVKDKINNWKQGHPVFLVYNEQKAQISSDAWMFQPEDSLKKVSGTTNKLIVELNEDSVMDSVAQLKVAGLEDLLIKEMLIAHLKQIGADLKTNNLEIDISEFLTTFGQAEEVVSQGTIKLPGEHILLEDWIQSLEGYEIQPGKTFSLIKAIEEVGLSAQDSIDINVLASATYTAVQKTNFTIVERHTSRELPDYAALGYEAYVKPQEMDFAFENPNATSYKLEFAIDQGNLVVSIVGVPLTYTYTVKVDKQVFKPKTIIHFNDQLADIFSSVVINGGREGYLVTVYRESFGKGGEEIESLKLSEDFYPPKHRIEERGYPVEEEEVTDPAIPENGVPGMPYPYPGYPYPTNPLDPNNPVTPGIPSNPDTKNPPETPTGDEDKKEEDSKKPPTDVGKENGGEKT